MALLIPAGLDLGNRSTQIHLLGKSASIPSVIGFDAPIIIGAKGTEVKAQAFSLLFRVDDKDHQLWFGRDVLASQSILQEIDATKYSKVTIQRLFQAVLFEWASIHKQDLSTLGKLNIVASMPPGLYQKPAILKLAESAYRSAFNTGQSHQKIRPVSGEAIQIVTKFGGLVREAVLFGQDIPRKNELVLIVDLGGGTTDFALFNGSDKPLDTKTVNNGLLHVYQDVDFVNPQKVELRIMSDRSYFPNQLLAYYNGIKLMISAVIRKLPRTPDKIYLIGGGAALMPKPIRASFKQLAREVIIKDQYVNAISNWKEAGKGV